MTRLALLRHGETAWSAAGRIQGRADIPLTEQARARWSARALPAACRELRIVASPLVRCVETAALLGATRAPREPRIIEMDWGRWQGRTLPELRSALGDAMSQNEDRGLDFRPEGGESPREVLARVGGWLRSLAHDGTPTLAVTHRGVIRVILAAALGWDMRGPPPAKLDWDAFHLFDLDAAGNPRVRQLNVK